MISLSGLMAWSLFARRDEHHFLRRLALWAIAAVTALLVWSPYWLSLPNGYAEVARNHSQYFVGFAGWTSGALRQREALEAFNSPWSWGGLTFVSAMLGRFWWTDAPKSWSPTQFFGGNLIVASAFAVLVLATIAASAITMSSNNFLLAGAVLGLIFGIQATFMSWLSQWQRPNAASQLDPRLVHCVFQRIDWLLAAWAIGLIVSTPLYRPYPRLVLPLLVGTIILVSRSFGVLPRVDRPVSKTKDRVLAWIFFALATVLLVAVSQRTIPVDSFRFRCWETRSQLREIAGDVTGDALKAAQAGNQKAIQNTRAVLYVYAEPGLFFHLPADGLAVQPVGNLNFVDIEATRRLPTFLVTGPHAQRSKAFADEFARRADQLELIASYPYDASDFVRLDDVSATQLHAHRERLEVRLYRVLVPE